jgi:hypothetical protein
VEVLHGPDGPVYRRRGRPTTLSELREELRGHGVDELWIRADRRVPWGAVDRILSICREPEVGIERVEFATWKPPERRS